MKKTTYAMVLALAGVAFTTPNVASAQTWASWTLPTCGGSVAGGLATYSGTYNAVQDASGAVACGSITPASNTNFWVPAAPYSPTPSNISFIQFNQAGGPNTITFNQAVIDPYIAMISVGQSSQSAWVTYVFSDAYSVISDNTVNPAYWGTGSYSSSVDMKTLVGKEFSGVLQFSGAYAAGQSISFSVRGDEYWHGFTVGTTSVVPEPSTYALMSIGLVGMGFAARRRNRV